MDPIEEIKSRLSIEDVVGRHVELKRSGASFKGLCPFHSEKTPSFYVTPNRGTFHCFGCGKGGDIFSFSMEMEKLPFAEALKALADEAGVTLPERQSTKTSLKNRLHEANELAARFFADALWASPGAQARRYLEERHFDRQAAELFGLGWAPDTWEALTQYLRKRGFEDRVLLAAGLIFHDDIGGKVRDRFHARLMFPIRDSAGKVAGFGGRTLGDSGPKYLNSPQTEIFDKSATLYGVHLAADAIRHENKAVLVEGYLDALRAHRAGYTSVVASLGTAVTTQQLLGLSRLTQTIVLALDPDPAGQAASARTALQALAEVTKAKGRVAGSPAALDLRIARLPQGNGDPDELIRDHPDMWESSIASSIPAFDFYFQQSMETLDRSSDNWRQEAIDRLLPLIQQFSSSAGWQAMWVERLAAETGVDPRALGRSLPTADGTRRARRPVTPNRNGNASVVSGTTSKALTNDPAISVEEGLLALLLTVIVLPDTAIDLLRSVEFERSEHALLLERLLEWQRNENYDYEMLRETFPENLLELADDLHARSVPLPEEGKVSVAVAFHLTRLRRFRIQSQLDRARRALADVDAEMKAEAVGTLGGLVTELREVDQMLERLSKLVLQASGEISSTQGTIDHDSGSL